MWTPWHLFDSNLSIIILESSMWQDKEGANGWFCLILPFSIIPPGESHFLLSLAVPTFLQTYLSIPEPLTLCYLEWIFLRVEEVLRLIPAADQTFGSGCFYSTTVPFNINYMFLFLTTLPLLHWSISHISTQSHGPWAWFLYSPGSNVSLVMTFLELSSLEHWHLFDNYSTVI